MLNAKDALGLQEDLAVMRANQARTNLPPVRQASGSNAMGAVAVALSASQGSMTKLRGELDSTLNSRNDIVAMGRASREVIDSLIEEVARLKGVSLESVQHVVYGTMSRRYDAHVEAMKAKGSIKWDLRQDPEVMKGRDWYLAAS